MVSVNCAKPKRLYTRFHGSVTVALPFKCASCTRLAVLLLKRVLRRSSNSDSLLSSLRALDHGLFGSMRVVRPFRWYFMSFPISAPPDIESHLSRGLESCHLSCHEPKQTLGGSRLRSTLCRPQAFPPGRQCRDERMTEVL